MDSENYGLTTQKKRPLSFLEKISDHLWIFILFLTAGGVLVLGELPMKAYRDYQLQDWKKSMGKVVSVNSHKETRRGHGSTRTVTVYESKVRFKTQDGAWHTLVHDEKLGRHDTYAVLYPEGKPKDAIVEKAKYLTIERVRNVGYFLMALAPFLSLCTYIGDKMNSRKCRKRMNNARHDR